MCSSPFWQLVCQRWCWCADLHSFEQVSCHSTVSVVTEWLWNGRHYLYAIQYTSSCGKYKCRVSGWRYSWWGCIFCHWYVKQHRKLLVNGLSLTETVTNNNRKQVAFQLQMKKGKKTACQLYLWKDTLCCQQCYLTVCAWTLSMILTLWILCSPVEQVIIQY